jgi:hypothetical protein
MVESCSGLTGDFDRVTWYAVPNSNAVERDGDSVGGYWAPVSNRIVLAGNAEFAGSLVRHEMLHALVKQTHGHSRSYFIDRCGGIVECLSPCSADVGAPPPPPANAVAVTANALRIDAHLIPDQPGSEIDDGIFTVDITVRNPNSYPVIVTLDPIWLRRTFFFQLYRDAGSGPTETDRVRDSSVTSFRGGEVKHRYFDLSLCDLPGVRRIDPGTYTLEGGYDNVSAIVPGVILK